MLLFGVFGLMALMGYSLSKASSVGLLGYVLFSINLLQTAQLGRGAQLRSRMMAATASFESPPSASSAVTTPLRSSAPRFWLNFHLL